jgi:serine/threonine-protein kinase HipA
MGGKTLGEVYCDRSGRVRLRYEEAYRSDDDAVPLSVSMPLSAARHKNSVVRPRLDNLLPDDPQVRVRWRREFGISDISPFALLRHVGEDVAGAAQFVRPDRVSEATSGGEFVPLDDAAVPGPRRRAGKQVRGRRGSKRGRRGRGD